MSALAWLFGFGLLAAAVPFVFHLIRRTPKGEVAFSSLMFLRPTPPTITRRSQLDNLLLLALRIGAVALIALAFMRPFFDSNVKLDFADVPGTKKAVLLDTSASMKRDGLWEKSLAKLQQVVDEAENNDEIAVYSFDSQLKKELGFSKRSEAANFTNKLKEASLQPGWNNSDLGGALVDLANRLLEEEQTDQPTEDKTATSSKLQVFVVSDMQSGSSTSALQNFQWPKPIKVQFVPVTDKASTNATLELLPLDESNPKEARENVLVRNSSESTSDQFSVSWEGGSLPPVPFIVPPGSSKILRVTRDPGSIGANRLALDGDDADFDNQFFALPPVAKTVTIHYFGDESADDPEGMLYYFQRALIETSTMSYDLQVRSSSNDAPEPSVDAPDLIVVSRSVSDSETAAINAFLKEGVTLLVALNNPAMIESTRTWTSIVGDEQQPTKEKTDYAMFGAIDFSAPVFAPFSGPRFNDFTQIRFWDFVRPELPDNVQVLAHFDDSTPAIWHQIAHDKSDIYTMGFGWQPEKSQLALSSKFLPLMMRLIELSDKSEPVSAINFVGDLIPVPEGYDQLVSPKNEIEMVEGPATPPLNSPGIYSLRSSSNANLPLLNIAVNIAPSESQTAPMPLDQITALGVETGVHETGEEEVERRRQLQDAELENRQKLWKWLVLGAIGLIVGESWLAGRTDRQNRRQDTELQGANDE